VKLYYSPGACSIVAHAALHQVKASTGTEFSAQLVNLKEGAQRSADYLAVNPRAQVPALEQGGKFLTQVSAICLYLDQQFPQARLFAQDAWLRGQQTSMLAWMNNTVHPTFTHVFRPEKFVAEDAGREQVKAFNKAQFGVLLQEIDELALQASPFLFGQDFCPVDAYALAFFRWGGNIGIDPESLPAYYRYVQNVAESSPMAQTLAAEGLQLVTYVKP
jgi:glutathione S-transferase